MRSLLDFLKKQKSYLLWGLIVAVSGAAVVYALQNGQNGQKYEPMSVQKVKLGRTIDATGFLEPATSIDLSFQKSGEVSKVNTEVGQRVKKGEILAQLKNESEKALLAQSKGILAEAAAQLNLKLAKATDQDIAIARANVQQSVASKQKAQVDLDNALVDLNNTKKTVEQDIKTAELEVENARLNLEKVGISSSTATQQTTSSVENGAAALKTSLGQLLVSAKAVLQNTDKIFGFEGLSIFDTIKPVNVTTSTEYVSAQNLYSKNLQSYKDLQSKFDALPAQPTADELLALSEDVSAFIRQMNDGVLASSIVLDKTTTSGEFPYATLTQLRTDLTTSGSSFNTAAANYNSAKSTLDAAIIDQSGTGGTSPLDVQSAELQVSQAEQNLTKVRVNGETMISTKETNVKAMQAQLQVAQSAVDRSNAELEKILASPRGVDVAPYRAIVQQAQAQVDKAQSDYDNTLIRAPFDGIITAKNIDEGEQFLVTAGMDADSPAMSIIDDSAFHIDVNIPETQVTKIDLSSKVTVTFDALGVSENFEAKILSIEPASTNVQSIIYYKAKVALVRIDERLKAGMTANVSIIANSEQEVLAIPERAITVSGNEKTVMFGPNKTLIIRTGLRGDNGMIEVVSGLTEGDTILVPVN
jgi:RND family efflux transporter MFP subunit